MTPRYWEIRDDIPAPRRRPRKKTTDRWPSRFVEMVVSLKVGQHFLCPHKDAGMASGVPSRCKMAVRSRNLNRDFTVRTEEDGVRIWRIS